MDKYVAFILVKSGGAFVKVEVFANSELQAREIIKIFPYFKSFAKMPVKS